VKLKLLEMTQGYGELLKQYGDHAALGIHGTQRLASTLTIALEQYLHPGKQTGNARIVSPP
jgi:hypothetical protein